MVGPPTAWRRGGDRRQRTRPPNGRPPRRPDRSAHRRTPAGAGSRHGVDRIPRGPVVDYLNAGLRDNENADRRWSMGRPDQQRLDGVLPDRPPTPPRQSPGAGRARGYREAAHGSDDQHLLAGCHIGQQPGQVRLGFVDANRLRHGLMVIQPLGWCLPRRPRRPPLRPRSRRPTSPASSDRSPCTWPAQPGLPAPKPRCPRDGDR